MNSKTTHEVIDKLMKKRDFQSVEVLQTLLCSSTVKAASGRFLAVNNYKWDKGENWTWTGTLPPVDPYAGAMIPSSNHDAYVTGTAPTTATRMWMRSGPAFGAPASWAALARNVYVGNIDSVTGSDKQEHVLIEGILNATAIVYGANNSTLDSMATPGASGGSAPSVLVQQGTTVVAPDVNLGAITVANQNAASFFDWTQNDGTVDAAALNLNVAKLNYTLNGGHLGITAALIGGTAASSANLGININGRSAQLVLKSNVFNTLVAAGCILAEGATVTAGNQSSLLDMDTTTAPGNVVASLSREYAWSPSPVAGAAIVAVNSDLSWSAGQSALSHDVFFGTNQSAVANARRLLGDIDGNGSVNFSDFVVLAGQWLTSPGLENPSADVVFSGEVDIEDFAALTADWLQTPDAEFKGNQTATASDPGTLAFETTYYWRIDEVNPTNAASPWTGTVWSFTTENDSSLPMAASLPSPPNGENNIWKEIDLSWIAGTNATSHNVYFGTNSTPGSGEYQGNQTSTNYPLGTLADNTTYYWRVDEVNGQGTNTGPVWIFTTESGTRLTPEQFPIMAWDGVGLGGMTKQIFDTMRSCGFNVAGHIKAKFLDVVANAGMKAFVVDFNCPGGGSVPNTPELVNLSRSEIDWRVDYMVTNYGTHAATLGYFVRDEPPTSDFAGLANWVDSYLTADPSHQIYMSLGYPYDWTNYLSTVPNTYLSYDFYGMMADGSVSYWYYYNLEMARNASISSGRPFRNTVESIKETFPDNPQWNTATPSPQTLRLQAYTSLAYGAKGISWFTYFSTQTTWPAPIVNGSKTDIWYYLQDVNMQLHRIGPIYLTLNSVYVFHYPNVPYGGKSISASQFVQSISGGDYCVGEFYDGASTPYLMVVNKSLTSDANLSLTLKSAYAGTLYRVNSATGQLQLFTPGQTLLPGEGMLLKIVN
ncbi:MAG: hypothetical protein AB8I69_10830 [Anaerolineae bacterium]